MRRCYRCMAEIGNSPICPHCGYDLRHQQEVPYALPPGSVLQGKYLIGNVLGQGGFGITYIGFDMILEVKVAIKEYYVSSCASRMGMQSQQVYWTADPGDMNHFITEARRMARLGEMPEIAHVRDIFYANQTAYIIMEYVEGVNLHTHLNNTGLMSYEQAVRLMLPVVEALGLVHKKDIVHRDISPDNLMMEPRGTLRVLDLGAAGDLSRNNAQATQIVVRHGFSPYEQHIPTGVIGPYTDVYAVCATIYYCCTGKVIPDAIDRMGRFMQTRKSGLDMDPRIPPAGAKVLQKGLALEIKDRYADMDILAAQLRKTLEPQKPVIPVPKPPVIPKIEIKKPSFPIPESDKKKTRQKKTVQKEKTVPLIQQSLPKNKLPILAGIGVLVIVMGLVAFTGTGSNPPEKVTEKAVMATEKQENTSSDTRTAGSMEKTVKPLEIVKSLEMTDVNVGDTEKITVLSGHHSREIKWSSSDPAVAEVSENGTVTALNDGTVEVTATLGDETVKCNVSISLRSNLAYTYETDSTGITITGYEGEVPAKLVLPSEIDGKKVTVVGKSYHTAGAYVFKGCENLTDVIIPDGVKAIGCGLFQGCTNLENVTIPDSVTTIGTNAFSDCTSLKRIVIPHSVKWIYPNAFDGCTSLENITIPSSVTYIGEDAFDDTPWLNRQNEEFVICGDGVLIQYNGTSPEVIIPSSVKLIAGSAFSNLKYLTAVTIPESVSEIGSCAFAESGLETIVFLGSVDTIGTSAFEKCEKLETVNLPAGITELENSVFRSCTKLKEITIPDGVTYIGYTAFAYCTSLTEINLPKNLTEIHQYAFMASGLKTVVIPENVKEIERCTFAECYDLSEVILHEGITSIGVEAFKDCTSLEKINLPSGIDQIGVEAFSGCTSLEKINLPSGIDQIRTETFSGCTNLKSIVIPEGVTSIGPDAFLNCTSLQNVTVPESVENIYEGAFYGCTSLRTVKLPKDCRLGGRPPTLPDFLNPSQGKTSDKKTGCFPDTCTLQYY